jgi:hypothetical protein
MALIAHGGPRRISALLHELVHSMDPRVKPIAAQSVAIHSEGRTPQRRYAPQRARFLESAAMKREMNRL